MTGLDQSLVTFLKCFRISILFSIIFFFPVSAISQVEIIQMNMRFARIKVPAKFVTAGLSRPDEGLSICWFEVKTPKNNFTFVTRRAVPYEECMSKVLRGRNLIKKGGVIELIGSSASKDKPNDYSALWETTESKNGCISYFGEKCEDKARLLDELNDWNNKAIDPKIYP